MKNQNTKIWAKIDSIGRAVPGDRWSTEDIMRKIKLPVKFKFELLTGIKSRFICKPGEDSFSLAKDAALECLRNSKLANLDIDMVISCSITRYRNGYRQQYEPSMAFQLKNALGLDNARSFDVSNACAGMFTGILTAKSYIEQGIIKNALVVSGEFISSLIHNAIKIIKTPSSQEFASLTVGDAGSAVLLQATEDESVALKSHGFTTQTDYNRLCTAQPRKRTPGAAMKTKAKQIHDVSIRNSIPVLDQALNFFGLKYKEIDYIIPHQTSRAAILSGSKTYSNFFKGSPGRVLMNLKENGNTASTSHFVCLYDYLKQGLFKPEDRVLAISYASGIVFGFLTFTINDLFRLHGGQNS